MNRRPQHPRGYTLVEVLAVVLILGIVSAIALPQFGPRDDVKVASAARALTARLLYARSRAITTGSMKYVTFQHDSFVLLESIDPAIQTPQAGEGAALGERPLCDGVTVQPNFDGELTLAFDAMGAPHAWSKRTGQISSLMAGSIVLKSGTESLTIDIEPATGDISVRRATNLR